MTKSAALAVAAGLFALFVGCRNKPAAPPDPRIDLHIAVTESGPQFMVNGQAVAEDKVVDALRQARQQSGFGDRTYVAITPDNDISWGLFANGLEMSARASIAKILLPAPFGRYRLPEVAETGDSPDPVPPVRITVRQQDDRFPVTVDSAETTLVDLPRVLKEIRSRDGHRTSVYLVASNPIHWAAPLEAMRAARAAGFVDIDFSSSCLEGRAESSLRKPPISTTLPDIQVDWEQPQYSQSVVTRFEGIEPYGPGKDANQESGPRD